MTWRGARGSVAMNYDPKQFTPALETIDSYTHGKEPIVVQRLRLTATQPALAMNGNFSFEVTA